MLCNNRNNIFFFEKEKFLISKFAARQKKMRKNKYKQENNATATKRTNIIFPFSLSLSEYLDLKYKLK